MNTPTKRAIVNIKAQVGELARKCVHNDIGEDNADARLKRTIMGRAVVVAITNGKLDFGLWEQIFCGGVTTQPTVILSGAKHLDIARTRLFASLRVTTCLSSDAASLMDADASACW